LIWFDLIWFDLIWFDLIWFDLIWFDLIWFDLIWFDLIWFDLKKLTMETLNLDLVNWCWAASGWLTLVLRVGLSTEFAAVMVLAWGWPLCWKTEDSCWSRHTASDDWTWDLKREEISS
jgi:hypothetical protein